MSKAKGKVKCCPMCKTVDFHHEGNFIFLCRNGHRWKDLADAPWYMKPTLKRRGS